MYHYVESPHPRMVYMRDGRWGDTSWTRDGGIVLISRVLAFCFSHLDHSRIMGSSCSMEVSNILKFGLIIELLVLYKTFPKF